MRVAPLRWKLRHVRREVILFLHALLVAMAAAFSESGVTMDPDLPVFLPRPMNVTYHRGDTAILPCAVENIGTKTIIWRRASDPNPLTIGDMVYVPEDRYAIQSVPERQEWNLLIKGVDKPDAGVYECQISSRHKLIHHIMLHVNTSPPPPVHNPPEISMNGTKFVEKGDPIHLHCNASGENYPPEDLDWFKDGVKVKADGLRHITIDKFRVLQTKTLVSVLTKKYSEMSDAGTYVCRSSNLGITSLKVHVLNAGSTNVRRGTSVTSSNSTSSSGHQQTPSSNCLLLILLIFTHGTIPVH